MMAQETKNSEVEALAEKAVSKAILERPTRVGLSHQNRTQKSLTTFLEIDVWPTLPAEAFGRPVSKQEREELLGYGLHGV